MDKNYEVIYRKDLKAPKAKYVQKKNGSKTLRFIIPLKDRLNFTKNILPFFNVIFPKLPRDFIGERYPERYFNALIRTSSTFSPDFLKKLSTEIKPFSQNQMELLLESNLYNLINAKKANILFDVLRIKNNIITKKFAPTNLNSRFIEAYPGFIRALKEKTIKVITLNIDGQDRQLIVKSFPGKGDRKKFDSITLGLDPKTFEMFGINEKRANKIKPFENLGSINLLEQNHYLQLKEIQEIKSLLSSYTLKNQSKNISSFKADVKRMTNDPFTLKIIKERFLKEKGISSRNVKSKGSFIKPLFSPSKAKKRLP